jgi:hypothetical protein
MQTLESHVKVSRGATHLGSARPPCHTRPHCQRLAEVGRWKGLGLIPAVDLVERRSGVGIFDCRVFGVGVLGTGTAADAGLAGLGAGAAWGPFR